MAAPLHHLLASARDALGLTHVRLAQIAGVSRRTVQRWMAAETRPKARQIVTLTQLVERTDASLAAELASAAGVALAPPPKPSGPPIELRMDSIVSAAADVANVAPHTMRRALAAALVRARELDVAPASLESLLRAAPAPRD